MTAFIHFRRFLAIHDGHFVIQNVSRRTLHTEGGTLPALISGIMLKRTPIQAQQIRKFEQSTAIFLSMWRWMNAGATQWVIRNLHAWAQTKFIHTFGVMSILVRSTNGQTLKSYVRCVVCRVPSAVLHAWCAMCFVHHSICIYVVPFLTDAQVGLVLLSILFDRAPMRARTTPVPLRRQQKTHLGLRNAQLRRASTSVMASTQ